jgi:N,N'-diacetyllegionaminate synthase
MRIGDFETSEHVLVVAEIGNNHEGNYDVAVELVTRAAKAGADAVKFQTFRTEHFISRADRDRWAHFKRFELTAKQFGALADHARSRDLLFISTPLDLGSAEVLEPLVDAFKIASGDNTFWPLIDRVASTSKPLLISAGLTGLDQIAETVKFVADVRDRSHSSGDLALLHCVSSYPVPAEEAELGAIEALRERFPDCTIGYSDHTIGSVASPLAVALGARIIEKHFTLDKEFSDFRDHRLSADPDELSELVVRIREAEMLVGERVKRVQPSEERATVATRRSIAAVTDLDEGHRVKASDLTWLRPGGGLAPGFEHLLVDHPLRRSVRAGEPLGVEDVS